MSAFDDKFILRPDLAIALGGVGWTALSCIALLRWLETNRVLPGRIATTGFATLPAALWALGMPAADIASHLAAHLPNRIFRRRDFLPYLSLLGIRLPDHGLSHALWQSGPLKRVCVRLFGDLRLETLKLRLHVTLIDCLSGGTSRHATGDIASLAYASTALLPALPPLRIDGSWLGDASACLAAPLADVLRPQVRHAIAVACSFPPQAHYSSLVDQQLTLQAALQRAGLKTSALLALDMLDGELIVMSARLHHPVDPFDVAITPEAIAAGDHACAQASQQLNLLFHQMHA
jgi:hypothetical protein